MRKDKDVFQRYEDGEDVSGAEYVGKAVAQGVVGVARYLTYLILGAVAFFVFGCIILSL